MANIVDPDDIAGTDSSTSFCFGYLEDNDTLYLGTTHHAEIIAGLINGGMTFEQLMATRQMWGWGEVESDQEDWYHDMIIPGVVDVSFSTDEARQDKGVKNKLRIALQQAFPGKKIEMEQGYGSASQETYGDRAREQYLGLRPVKLPDGTKVQIHKWYGGHDNGQIGTIVGWEPSQWGGEGGMFTVQFDDGSQDEYSEHALKVLSSVRTAGSYSRPAFTSEDGFKIFDARHNSGRDVLNHGYWGLCFGAIEKEIYLGDQHHAKIIYNLVDGGTYSYETLMSARQKWGWIRRDDDGNLEVSFTTDEALQTQDREYSQSVVDTIGEYFNRHAYYEGEGYSNAHNYGERSKQQYFGEGSEEAYCDHCDTWYDPYEEDHDHDITYCDTCEEYYDANDPNESYHHEHVTVKYNVSNPTTQSWIQAAAEHGRELNAERADYDPDWVDEADLEVWLLLDHNFDRDSAEWVAEKAMDLIRSKPKTPDWMPAGLHMVPTQKVLQTDMTPSPALPQKGDRYTVGGYGTHAGSLLTVIYVDPEGKTVWMKDESTGQDNTYPIKTFNYYVNNGSFKKISMIRVTDLRDAEVFAKISADYIKLGAGEDNINRIQNALTENQKPIEIGSQWTDDTGERHTVTNVEDGRVYYELANGHGDMSENIWRYYMKPIADAFSYPADATSLPDNQEQPQQTIDPIAEGAMKDDPTLLAIERNPESQEWRWSMDNNQLHIWRVLNRWQYGPSHYDMFGSEGYNDHSQGRVYVAPDGRVGVLYWQISHDNAEQTLNDWVQKTYGKQPDYVYRAYGPYKGFKTPRYYFPIVEVSGLPIPNSARWWEHGELPNMWYHDQGLTPPGKKKNYPAKPTKKVTPLEDMRADDFNLKKQKRRRRRQRKNQYRNRSRR